MHVDEENPLVSPVWYRKFRELFHRYPEFAAKIWSLQWVEDKRIEFVWLAARNLHLDSLKWSLLREDGRIDANAIRDQKGLSLLHEVASNVNATVSKMLAAFEFLVNRMHCEVDVRDSEGRTALHCVCGSHVKRSRRGRQKYIRLLKLLVEKGADVNCQFHRITPLHLVHESPWALRYLVLEANAQADVQDTFQRTPLLWSLRNPHLPLSRQIPVSIFQGRMDFLASDYMGHSPIHYAVVRGRSDEKLQDTIQLIDKLVRAGANVDLQNRRLRTALYFLVHTPNLRELAESLIRDYGADVNLCDADGYTVVHMAAILGQPEYVASFLPYMRNNVQTIDGETVRSCLEKYCEPKAITPELENLLRELELKGNKTAPRVYKEPYTVWEYVNMLDHHRDLFSLYIVDTFFRYRGGRALFSDIFHHISYSAAIKKRSQDFLARMSQWNGSKRSQLFSIVDEFSVTAEDSESIAQSVDLMVRDLMERVRIKDAANTENPFRWQLDVLPVGSAVDGSKILLPDEFDFLVVFRHFHPGDRDPSLSRDYVNEVEQFRIILINCIQEKDAELLEQRDARLGFEFVDCELRRVCLNLRMTWRQEPYKNVPICIDLTPVFRFEGWEDQSGFRPLRPLSSLPEWFLRDGQVIEHFRPIHNLATILPCAATMEVRCLKHPSHHLLQYCLRLLKLIIQCDYIIRDVPVPSSHLLKVGLLGYAQEHGLPTKDCHVAEYVRDVCYRLRDADNRWISSFVAEAQISLPTISIREDLVSILNKLGPTFSFHECTHL